MGAEEENETLTQAGTIVAGECSQTRTEKEITPSDFSESVEDVSNNHAQTQNQTYTYTSPRIIHFPKTDDSTTPPILIIEDSQLNSATEIRSISENFIVDIKHSFGGFPPPPPPRPPGKVVFRDLSACLAICTVLSFAVTFLLLMVATKKFEGQHLSDSVAFRISVSSLFIEFIFLMALLVLSTIEDLRYSLFLKFFLATFAFVALLAPTVLVIQIFTKQHVVRKFGWLLFACVFGSVSYGIIDKL